MLRKKQEKRKQNDKKIERLFEELIKHCEECKSYELCEMIKKLKIIHFAIKEYDKATSRVRLKTGIIIIIEALLVVLMVKYTNYIFYILIIFIIMQIYSYFEKYRYRKYTIEHLTKLGNLLGIPEEKQKELKRCLEGKPSLTAEKLMNCKLRKERGLNYCVSCPDSYICAAGLPSPTKR